ncbi:MAG TPA: alpha/beta fold hydrolase [Woeseiaceae bacterium]|jgi:alpha/beta superfamily hydrolase|nr:alpha/beta fold hydrolase [Woeseiaceae bacterium]
MARPPKSENTTIEGPGGRLEARVEIPGERKPEGVAVICHPHPLHGGSMQNKVVHTLARAFVAAGFLALRFNFRGVGESEGRFDDGSGELQDALAAAREARRRMADGPLWLAGFSFGAAIAIRAAAELDADGLITVAPAVARVAALAGPEPRCPWLVIQGDRDELVDVDGTIEWVNAMAPGPELRVFPETEHFFHGKLVELRKAVEAFVADHVVP